MPIHMKLVKRVLTAKVNFHVILCFIRNKKEGGRSKYPHRRSYEAQSIRIFHDEKKCKYSNSSLYVHIFGRANTIQMNDTGKLMKVCRTI